MSIINALSDKFDTVLQDFFGTEPMAHVASGKMQRDEYRSFVRQVYYYVRENPQLQALATVYFRGEQRDLVRPFYQHATSEIGHEQLALNDFVELGGDAEHVPYRNPLPATTALTAFAFYQIYNRNPLGYLGYLYFLEFVPTRSGGVIAAHLDNIGVPQSAMTFLRDHMEIDVAHNRLMERYVESLLKTDADFDSVVYAMQTTAHLYSQMIDASIKDAWAETDTGWNWEELHADGKTVPDRKQLKIVS